MIVGCCSCIVGGWLDVAGSDHAGSFLRNESVGHGGEFVAVPKEHDGVDPEHDGGGQGKVGKAEGTRKEIDVKEEKEEKENLGKELHALPAPKGNDRKDFHDPHPAQDQKGQNLVAAVKLNQEKHHAHHNGTKDKVLHEVQKDEFAKVPFLPHVSLELNGKLEHALLCLVERKGREGRGNKEQKDGR